MGYRLRTLNSNKLSLTLEKSTHANNIYALLRHNHTWYRNCSMSPIWRLLFTFINCKWFINVGADLEYELVGPVQQIDREHAITCGGAQTQPCSPSRAGHGQSWQISSQLPPIVAHSWSWCGLRMPSSNFCYMARVLFEKRPALYFF